MANTYLLITLGTTGPDGVPLGVTVAQKGDAVALAGTAVTDATTADTDVATAVTDYATVMSGGTDFTAVDNAVSTLVADGATPTQAHVTTLNTNWGTFKTAQATLKTDIDTAKTATATAKTDATNVQTAVTADMIVGFDTSKVTTRNKAAYALRQALKYIESGYGGLAAN